MSTMEEDDSMNMEGTEVDVKSVKSDSLAASSTCGNSDRLGGHVSSRSLLRAAAETMVVQAEELAREALFSNLTDYVNQAIQPIKERLDTLERQSGKTEPAVPEFAGGTTEFWLDLVAEKCQAAVQKFDSRLDIAEATTTSELKQFEEKLAALTKSLGSSKQRWTQELQQIWEAVDSHTHDVNVDDDDDLQTLPAAVFRGKRPSYDVAEGDITEGVDELNLEELESPYTIFTGTALSPTTTVLDHATPKHALLQVHEEPITDSKTRLVTESPPMVSEHRGQVDPTSASFAGTSAKSPASVPTWATVPFDSFISTNTGQALGQTLPQAFPTAGVVSKGSKGSTPVGSVTLTIGGGTPVASLHLPVGAKSPGTPQLAGNAIRRQYSADGTPAQAVAVPLGSTSDVDSRSYVDSSSAGDARSRSSPPAVFRDLPELVATTLTNVANQIGSNSPQRAGPPADGSRRGSSPPANSATAAAKLAQTSPNVNTARRRAASPQGEYVKVVQPGQHAAMAAVHQWQRAANTAVRGQNLCGSISVHVQGKLQPGSPGGPAVPIETLGSRAQSSPPEMLSHVTRSPRCGTPNMRSSLRGLSPQVSVVAPAAPRHASPQMEGSRRGCVSASVSGSTTGPSHISKDASPSPQPMSPGAALAMGLTPSPTKSPAVLVVHPKSATTPKQPMVEPPKSAPAATPPAGSRGCQTMHSTPNAPFRTPLATPVGLRESRAARMDPLSRTSPPVLRSLQVLEQLSPKNSRRQTHNAKHGSPPAARNYPTDVTPPQVVNGAAPGALRHWQQVLAQKGQSRSSLGTLSTQGNVVMPASVVAVPPSPGMRPSRSSG